MRFHAFARTCVTASVLFAFLHTQQGLASTNHHVILITIDGLAAYYLTDPKAPMPILRKLAAEGTVAAGMRVSNPAITWPNHTTLVTGMHPAKHSVLFNGVLTPPPRPQSSRRCADARRR
jgi:predicted AlkP superfamily pyrophosphatase or phosphodiesterase